MEPELARRNAALDTVLSYPVVQVSEALLSRLRAEHAKPPSAVRTFLPDWNAACRGQGAGRGLAHGWYVILAGATGAGKTLLALNLIAEALQQGVNVLYFSLEMTWQELLTRLRGIVTRQEITHLEPGSYYSPLKAEAADQEILGLDGKLFLNEEPIWKLSDIRELMEAYVETDDVRLFVVDYAQLVEPSGSEQRMYEAVASISSQLRYQAQRLGAVTVALSQLNRTASGSGSTTPPTVDGLFASSRLGFDADQVLILDHTRQQANEAERIRNTILRLAKNRHGPQLDIPIQLSTASLRVRQIMPHEEEDAWPGGWNAR